MPVGFCVGYFEHDDFAGAVGVEELYHVRNNLNLESQTARTGKQSKAFSYGLQTSIRRGTFLKRGWMHRDLCIHTFNVIAAVTAQKKALHIVLGAK